MNKQLGLFIVFIAANGAAGAQYKCRAVIGLSGQGQKSFQKRYDPGVKIADRIGAWDRIRVYFTGSGDRPVATIWDRTTNDVSQAIVRNGDNLIRVSQYNPSVGGATLTCNILAD